MFIDTENIQNKLASHKKTNLIDTEKDIIFQNTKEELREIQGVPSKIKIIEYKGKQKRIPAKNEDETLCEFYIVKKMRYCRFKKVFADELIEKNKDKNLIGEFCVYHQPLKENVDNEFILCPIDPTHSVKKSKLNKHVKKCNFLVQKEKVTKNVWYKKDANICFESLEILQKNNLIEKTLDDLYSNSFWENLSEEKYENLLDKIIYAYEKLKDDYGKYIKIQKIQKKIKENNLKISSQEFDEKDLLSTAQLPKGIKMEKQNEVISKLIENFGLLVDEKNKKDENENEYQKTIFVEFGAGKAGLSHFINNYSGDKTIHYLLERGSNRYKKDRYSDKLIRFKSDIKDFDIDYLDVDIKDKFSLFFKKSEKNKNDLIQITSYDTKTNKSKYTPNYSLLGIAKHICGCALDLSLSCLLNFTEKNKIKGFCLATCCHNICRLEYINNLNFFLCKLNFNLEEIIFLFKATSWLFGSIDPEKAEKIRQMQNEKKDKNEKSEENEIDYENSDEELEEELNKLKERENMDKVQNVNLDSKSIFERRKLKKEYIGLISKYIIDLTRVFFLIEKGFDVFYIKYISNEITTENNLILALKE